MSIPFMQTNRCKGAKKLDFKKRIPICVLPFKHHLVGVEVKIKVPEEWNNYPGYLLNGKYGIFVREGGENYSLIQFEGIHNPISLIDSVIFIKP